MISEICEYKIGSTESPIDSMFKILLLNSLI